MKNFTTVLVLWQLLVAAVALRAADPGGKFEPADGDCLLILGQSDPESMNAYLAEVRSTPSPAGFSFYTSLSDGSVEKRMAEVGKFFAVYPHSSLLLGIWTGERKFGDPGYYLDRVVQGRYDVNIATLAEACKELKRPVFIRFGYEFDGAHNAYPPEKYIAAYRHFVDRMRAAGVTNVAYVWHSWGVRPSYDTQNDPEFYPPLEPGMQPTPELWYPGNDYVDWVGLSIFGTGWGDLSKYDPVQWLLGFAESRDKPVMVAESAAIKTGARDPGWTIPNRKWLKNVFDLCARDSVKALTYINRDWEARNKTSTWGDTRIQHAAPGVKRFWLEQTASFLHAGPSLRRARDGSPLE